jgi:hypothetical protein
MSKLFVLQMIRIIALFGVVCAAAVPASAQSILTFNSAPPACGPVGNILAGGNGMTSGWSLGGATLTNGQPGDPCGGATASKLIEGAAAGGHSTYATTVSFAASTAYTCDIYFKALGSGSARNLLVYADDATFTHGAFAIFRASDGVLTDSTVHSPTTMSSTNTSAAGSWFRVGITLNFNANTGNWMSFYLTNGTTLGSQSYTGDGASGLLLWGPSCRVGSSP